MMKKLLFLLLIGYGCSYAQTQIGTDINGEAAYDNSGFKVSLSSDGTILAIGSIYNDGNGTDAGSVRVYKNVSGNWTQIGADIDGEVAGDMCGRSVSLSNDGTVLAIGANRNDGNGTDAGSVRVYKNVTGNWTQIGADIDGESANDLSGSNICLSSDGTIVAIGAHQNDGNGTDAGSVRVYKNVSGNWTQIGADIDGESAGDMSSWGLSLSSDGTIVAIGTIFNDGNGTNAGSVRIYKNVFGNWTQIGADIDGKGEFDFSGESVSLSSDGSIVAIGTINNFGVTTYYAGSVRVYKNVSGNWTQIGADINGEAANDYSGFSVSLSSDGSIVVIGALYNDGSETDAGSVRVYKNVLENWTQIGADIDGEATDDLSGNSVSLSNNGNTLAIGAINNNGNGTDSGHVRVYGLSTILQSDSFIQANFSIYPNPASKLVNIILNQEVILEKVNIYNQQGQFVKNSKKTSVDISELANGTYFVEVVTNEGKATKQLIIE